MMNKFNVILSNEKNNKNRDRYHFICKYSVSVITTENETDFSDVLSKHYKLSKKSRRDSFYCKKQ